MKISELKKQINDYLELVNDTEVWFRLDQLTIKLDYEQDESIEEQSISARIVVYKKDEGYETSLHPDSNSTEGLINAVKLEVMGYRKPKPLDKMEIA